MCAPASGVKLVVVSSYVNAVMRWRHQKLVLAVNSDMSAAAESVLFSLKCSAPPAFPISLEEQPARLRRPRRATARVRRLYWRAGNRAVRAEDATIARLGPQQGPATCALVKVDACIGRHGFALPMPAGWTSQFALEKGLGHHCAIPRPEHLYVGKARTG